MVPSVLSVTTKEAYVEAMQPHVTNNTIIDLEERADIERKLAARGGYKYFLLKYLMGLYFLDDTNNNIPNHQKIKTYE